MTNVNLLSDGEKIPFQFQSAEDYFYVNRGAVRRPIIPLGAPLLTQHFVFWKPVGLPEDVWKLAVDRFLWHILVQALPTDQGPQKTSDDQDALPHNPTDEQKEAHDAQYFSKYIDWLKTNHDFKCYDVKLQNNNKFRLDLLFHKLDFMLTRKPQPITTDWLDNAKRDNNEHDKFIKLEDGDKVVRNESFSFSVRHEIKVNENAIKCKLRCWAEHTNEYFTLTFIAGFARFHQYNPNNSAIGHNGENTRFEPDSKTKENLLLELFKPKSEIFFEHIKTQFFNDDHVNEICGALKTAETLQPLSILESSYVAPQGDDASLAPRRLTKDEQKLIPSCFHYYADFRGAVLARIERQKSDELNAYDDWVLVGPGDRTLTDPDTPAGKGVEATSATQNLKYIDKSWRSLKPDSKRSPRATEFQSYKKFDKDPSGHDRAVQLVDDTWSYIHATFSSDTNSEIDPNLAVTRLLDDRLLHISSLGVSGPSSGQRPAEPVRFILITSAINEWLLGHAVERIHGLGTARLAIMKNIKDLQDFSEALDRIQEEWNLMADQRKKEDYVNKIYDELQKALNKVKPGGALDRIARSEYYQSMFKQIQTGLGIGLPNNLPVSSFQTYDDFTTRRLGGTFEFIKRLKIRYRNLRSLFEAEIEKFDSDNLLQLRRDTKDSVDKIVSSTKSLDDAVKQLNDNSETQKSNIQETRKLLETSDFVLPIIVWYHLGAIFHYLNTPAWLGQLLLIFSDYISNPRPDFIVGVVNYFESFDHNEVDSVLSFIIALSVTVYIFRNKFKARLVKLLQKIKRPLS